MDNQQVNNLLFENVDINKLKNKNLQDENKIFNIIKDIHMSYKHLKDTYGLSRDMAKKFKNKLYNQYERHVPDGYRQDPSSIKHLVNREGEVINKRTRINIKQHVNGCGYLQYCGFNKKSVRVHNSVAKAFIPNVDKEKKCINHIDGNKLNNNASNLEWVTYQENTRHAFTTGLIDRKKLSESTRGSGNSQAVLTTEDVLNIRNLKKLPPSVLAHHFGVSVPTIYDILNGRSWTHI